MASTLLPLELIDKCVGSRIWVIMKGDKGTSHILHHLYPHPDNKHFGAKSKLDFLHDVLKQDDLPAAP